MLYNLYSKWKKVGRKNKYNNKKNSLQKKIKINKIFNVGIHVTKTFLIYNLYYFTPIKLN